MKMILAILVMLNISLWAKYPDTKSCQECHEDIHYEHVNSMHHKSTIFSDEVHRKVKNLVNKEKYSCAICHMPATSNLAGVIRGVDQPDNSEVRQRDGVSCFYCHQIKGVYHAAAFNINFSSYKKGEKPTVFGNLDNVDDSDKHTTSHNKIFKNSEVCMGCHSHKQNSLEFEVCNTKDQLDATSDCIGCHMPKSPGKVEKFNKKGRDEYATHNFLGIHSIEMIKKAVKIDLSYKKGAITLKIENKMGHSIITHPMRLKFAKTVVSRAGKVIWKNFDKSPVEDKEATFIIVFKDSNGKPAMPHKAIGYKLNRNLKAMSSKTIVYKVADLKKGDKITTTWISYVVNPKIAKKLQITTDDVVKPYKGIVKSVVVK